MKLLRRFLYWPPWNCTQWWWFKFFRGTDEWHNKSVALKLPFLGCLIFFWEKDFSREGPEHVSGFSVEEGFEGELVDGCGICQDMLAEFDQTMQQDWPADFNDDDADQFSSEFIRQVERERETAREEKRNRPL